MSISIIQATPDTISALKDTSVIGQLGWAELIAIVALVLPIAVQLVLLDRQKVRERVTSTLDFHREYNSSEMAKARTGALRFVHANLSIDWVNDPEIQSHDVGDVTASNLFEIMRFFHRVNVVRNRNRLDKKLLAELIGPELAWWDGFIFHRMANRAQSRTIPDIKQLSSALEAILGPADWQRNQSRGERYAQGRP